MKRFLILLVFLLCASPAWGAVFYAAPTAAGTEDGSSVENAMTLPNAETRCPRGDSIAVTEGTYPAVTFNKADSAGVAITIFRTGSGQAVLGKPVVSTGQYKFDGVSRGADWISDYGFKISTVGAPGKGITISADSVIVQYVEIEGNGPDDAAASDDGVYAITNNVGLQFRYMYIHDNGRCPFLGRGWDNATVEYCYVARNESEAVQHAEGVSLYSETCDNNIFRYNKWVDIEGTGVIVVGDGTGNEFYGNLIYWTADYPAAGQNGGYISNGSIASWTTETHSNSKYYNNTIIIPASGGLNFACSNSGAGTGNVAYNNAYLCAGTIGTRISYDDGTTHDYNAYSGGNTETEANEQTNIDTTYVTDFSGYDFSLVKATEPWTVLAAPYNTDLAGTTRAVDGNGDRWYLEYDSTGGDGVDVEDAITYWVDLHGHTADGTQASPDSTFALAEARANLNDVIRSKGARNGEKIVFPASGVQYRAWDDTSKTIIGGPKPLSGWTAPSGGGTVIDSVHVVADADDKYYRSSNRTVYNATSMTVSSTYTAFIRFDLSGESITNFASWASFKIQHCSPSDVAATQLKYFAKNDNNAVSITDTLSVDAAFADAVADSATGDTIDPAADTWYMGPEMASVVNAIEGTPAAILVWIKLVTGAATAMYDVSNANTSEAVLYYTYNQTGSPATFAYRALTGVEQSIARVWKDGVLMTEVADSTLVEAGKYAIDDNKIYVIIADTSAVITCDGYGENVVDTNGQTGGLISRVVIKGNGVTGFAVLVDGDSTEVYNCAIDSSRYGVKILSNNAKFKNNAISASDTALIITPGLTGVEHDYNAWIDKSPGESTMPDKFIRPNVFDVQRRAA